MSDGRPPTIAVASQVWLGHVPAYHRGYAEAFRATGAHVVEWVRGRPAAGTEGNGNYGAMRRRAMRSFLARAGLLPLAQGVAAWRWLDRQRAAEEAGGTHVDAVFLVYLDQMFLHRALPLRWIERRCPRPWAGLRQHPAPIQGRRADERPLRSRYCRAIGVVDGAFVAPCVAAWPGRTVVRVPELADVSAPDPSAPAAAELSRWAAGRKVVGLLGVCGEKKNIPTFVEMARRAERAGDGVVFAIVGECSADASGTGYRKLARLLRGLPGNCRAWPDRLADGGAFNAVVAACDVIFLAYRPAPDGSNVLTKAAYFRKPVIASEGHLIADAVQAHRLGAVVPAADAGAALAAVRALLADDVTKCDFAGAYARNAVERLPEVARRFREALHA
jgi:glycosyltransferase involved in cell wall biosynthesis